MSVVSPLPQTPVPSGVTYEDRISIRLNRAGTEAQNPIVGSDAYLESGGLHVRLRFNLSDAAESISSSFVTAYNDAGDELSSTSIKSSWVRNTTTLQATAELQAGIDIPSTALGQRSIVTVKTNRRVVRQQVWVRDAPDDIVVFNGIVTTSTEPLMVTMEQIDGNTPFSWSTSFFPTWNDELGRQHGANATSLQGLVQKPYGGAATVEVYRWVGANVLGALVQAETSVENQTTLTSTPTGDGQFEAYTFLFRSVAGSANRVVGYGFIQFNECDEGSGGGGSGGSCPPPNPIPPVISPQGTTILTDPVSQLAIAVDALGVGGDGSDEETNTDVTVTVTAYHGGVFDNGSSDPAEPIAVVLGTQVETYSATGNETIDLDTAIQGASLYLVEIESAASGGDIGNTVVFTSDQADEGALPTIPVVSSVSLNLSTGAFTFDLDSLGWDGETVVAHVKPFTSIIQEGGSAAQDYTDLAVEADETELTVNYTTTGSKSTTVTLPTGTTAASVYFTNSFGSTTATFSDDGTVDYGLVKRGPTIQTLEMESNGDLTFEVSGGGSNNGNFIVEYAVFDSAGDYRYRTAFTVATPSVGSKTFTPDSGDIDIDGQYLVWLVGEQGGSSRPIILDNTGGANLLGTPA